MNEARRMRSIIPSYQRVRRHTARAREVHAAVDAVLFHQNNMVASVENDCGGGGQAHHNRFGPARGCQHERPQVLVTLRRRVGEGYPGTLKGLATGPEPRLKGAVVPEVERDEALPA